MAETEPGTPRHSAQARNPLPRIPSARTCPKRGRGAAAATRVSGIRARTGGASRRRVSVTGRAARNCRSTIYVPGQNGPMQAEEVIATHGNTDFDAFAAMLAARRLYPG